MYRRTGYKKDNKKGLQEQMKKEQEQKHVWLICSVFSP